MKLTILLFTVAFLNVHATGRAQNVTISGKDLSLKQVFSDIEMQTGYVVFGNNDFIAKAGSISLSVHDMPLRELLKMVLKGSALDFELKEDTKTIVLSERSAPAAIWSIAQPVKGTIRDNQGKPLAGATISIAGSKTSVISDKDGNFTINANTGDELIITYVGFNTRKLVVSGSELGIISMMSAETSLNEITVSTGYWSTVKRKSVNNITKIDGKEIANQPVTTLLNSLIGLVPGLDVTPNNGSPGSASSIEIRGRNSLNFTGSKPLFVVDGIQIDSKPLGSYGALMYSNIGFDPLSGISPGNIESIEVLKDAAATAIYGTRGANGVIRITTKKAKFTSKNTFDLNIYQGAGWLPRKVDLLDSKQYMAMRREAYANDAVAPNNFTADVTGFWDTTRYTDWQQVLLGGTANITNMDASYAGGNEVNSFRIGGGYHKETTIYPGDDFGMQRATTEFSFNHLSPDKRLQVQAAVNFGWTKTRSYDLNTRAALTLPPVAPPVYNEDGTLNWAPRPYFGLMYHTWDNPMAAMERTQESIANTIFSSGIATYELAKGLRIRTSVSHTHTYNDEHAIDPIKSGSPTFWQYSTGTAFFNQNNRKALMVEPQITYDKSFGEHNVHAIVGGSWQKSSTLYRVIIGADYPSDAFLGSLEGAKFRVFAEDDNFHYRYASFYARIGYDFKNRYMLDVIGRRDGSSRFGPGKRYGNFGAIGASWIFSDEPWLKSRFLSFGKLRGSYGLTGSDQIEDYKYLDTYDIIGSGGYQNGISVRPSALNNPDYRWEQTTKLELALELGLLENRIMLEASWYKHRTSDQLVTYPLAYTTGFDGVNANFDAIVQNTGLELMVSTKNISTSHFSWTTAFNLSIPRNKLVKFDGIESSPYATVYKVGEPLSIARYYTYKGINPQTGLYEVEDLNGDGNFDDRDYSFMDPMGRKKYAGLQNNLVYRNFDLWLSFQLSDNPVSGFLPAGFPGSFSNQAVEVLKRWQKPGDDQPYQRFTVAHGEEFSRVTSSNFNIQEAAFIRLRSLAFGYRLGQGLLARTGIKEARFYLQGQNLFTISKFKLGYDPETVNNLPSLRMLTAGLQIKL